MLDHILRAGAVRESVEGTSGVMVLGVVLFVFPGNVPDDASAGGVVSSASGIEEPSAASVGELKPVYCRVVVCAAVDIASSIVRIEIVLFIVFSEKMKGYVIMCIEENVPRVKVRLYPKSRLQAFK